MFYNYFKVAVRNLLRARGYSLIHILGLTAGVAGCLIIAVFLFDEYSYDQFHEKGDRIFRVNTDLQFPDQTLELALAAGPAGPALESSFAAVADYVRLASPWGKVLISNGDRKYFEEEVLFADSSFFRIFDFPLTTGNAERVLQGPNSMVISREKARLYFDKKDPVGETLTVDGEEYQITGVAGSMPQNSHINFSFLLPWSNWEKKHPGSKVNWTWTSFPTYILLREGSNSTALSGQLADFLKESVPADQANFKMALGLEPFREIHFNEARLGELAPKGNKEYLLFLALIAVFILALAIANYINLSTAIYAGRTKEIGVRKTLGAGHWQIAFQYLTEGIVVCFIGITGAFVIAYSLLPYVSQWLNRELNFDQLAAPFLLALIPAGAIILGVLAASYPAILMAGMKPVKVLYHNETGSLGRESIRKGLTVMQFAISIGLILSTVVLWQQVRFMMNKDLGFDQRAKLVIDFGSLERLSQSPATIRQELSAIPGVKDVSFSSHVPSDAAPHGLATSIEKDNGETATAEVELYLVDFNFMDLYDLQVVAGRQFLPEFTQDTAGALILNRSAVQLLGFSSPEEVIGQPFEQWGRSGRVVGVAEDFVYKSLHQKIGAMTFQINPDLFEKLTVQLSHSSPSQALPVLERKWAALNENLPFQYSFLDERLAWQYQSDSRLAGMISLFTGLAIILSCLGLIGLVAYTCRRKAKDFAIRKVFGAEATDIIWGLFQRFSKPIVWAWLIAVVPAYWFLDQWLDSFAYRIDIAWWWVAASGIATILLAGLVIGWQSLATASANPVKFLRDE